MTKNSGTKRGTGIQHPKRRGEWAEVCFLKRAIEVGLEVSKPWGESASYDFIVESAQRMARVQVKSTTYRYSNGYRCTVHDCSGRAYEGDPFDFVAAYLVPEDIWYIIPAEILSGKGDVGLYPGAKWSKCERFREAWHLLPGEPAGTTTKTKRGRVRSIQACAEEWNSGQLAVLSSQFSVLDLLGEGSQLPLAGV